MTIEAAATVATRSAPVSPAWWDIHARLMPDYNARAATYWWVVVGLGAAVLSYSAYGLLGADRTVWFHIAICTGMAMLAGLVPVRVPGSINSFTAGEVFIFLLLLLHGVQAAAVASACEALVGTCRTSKRWTSWIASPAMAALALFCAGSLLEWAREDMTTRGVASDALLSVAAIAFAMAYFVINTLLVTTVSILKRNQPVSFSELAGHFGWLWLAYSANAAVAAILYITYRQAGMVVVITAAPVIAILLTTGHYFFRRKEAEQAIVAARASEAELARQHVGELEASERRFHSAFTQASIGMALVSFDGRIRQSNAALKTLLGLSTGQTHRLDFNHFVSADGQSTLANLIATIAGDSQQRFAAELRCRYGREDIWIAVNGSLFSEPVSTEECLILQVQDISARKRAETELHHIAFHDNLTGLPNRHRFNEHLAGAIQRVHGQAPGASGYGVLFLDFDRFKLINDSLGHNVGDEFLVKVARRIQHSLRPIDIVARLGGDEFAILIPDSSDTNMVVNLADRLQHILCRPLTIAGAEVTVSASMGITTSEIGYSRAEDVLRDADIAMYKAKSSGKARYALFDVGLHDQIANKLKMEGELRRALASEDLHVEYQPLYDLANKRLLGFEALARWNHPELGQVSPATFIPIAEESGSMVQLTDFVLGRACTQLKAWQELAPRYGSLKMHVNVASNDLASSNFVSRITRALVTSRIEPHCLSIELTENILMESLASAMAMLTELHGLGVGLSVDDFGTGYSSLSHLSTLPIDCLKIDRSFVKNLSPGSKEAAVIRAIVLLGKSLGKEVIAEGIETAEQLAALTELTCDVGQGYLLGRPLKVEAVDALLSSGIEARTVDNVFPISAFAKFN